MMKEMLQPSESLRRATNEREYQESLITLLRQHATVEVNRIRLPLSPGASGKLKHGVRSLFWKLFKHQHEQVTFHHNAVHELQAAATEHGHHLLQKRIDELEARLVRLEKERETRQQ